MNNDTIVKFDRVQKSYDGEILVVKDLNLDIKRGEFLTLLGPSGSGKTTTLLILMIHGCWSVRPNLNACWSPMTKIFSRS